MPSIKENLYLWDEKYGWLEDGDEWKNQAYFCGVSYTEWKDELVNYFILPYISSSQTVLEIAVGHGRWTEILLNLSKDKRYMGIDIGKNCIEFCKKKFIQFENAEFFVNNGKDLSAISSSTVDFIWSYDSFVHMEIDVLESYLSEIFRILTPMGKACIHHPGNPSPEQRKAGWRSNITKEIVSKLALKYNLGIVQSDSWGLNNRCNAKLFGDYISLLYR